jgi:putative membrane protein
MMGGGTMYMHDMTGWMGGWGWLGMTLMMLLWVAVLALIVYAVVRLVARGDRPSPTAQGEDPALGTLRQRFARGEITEEEYRRAQQVLTGASS